MHIPNEGQRSYTNSTVQTQAVLREAAIECKWHALAEHSLERSCLSERPENICMFTGTFKQNNQHGSSTKKGKVISGKAKLVMLSIYGTLKWTHPQKS